MILQDVETLMFYDGPLSSIAYTKEHRFVYTHMFLDFDQYAFVPISFSEMFIIERIPIRPLFRDGRKVYIYTYSTDSIKESSFEEVEGCLPVSDQMSIKYK